GEIDHVRLLVPDLVDEVVATVLAQLACRKLGKLQRIGLRHDVRVERTGGKGEVHHARTHRVAHLERRHRLRPADEVEVDDPLAGVVYLADEPLEVLDVLSVFAEGAYNAQGGFLGLQAAGGQSGGRQ